MAKSASELSDMVVDVLESGVSWGDGEARDKDMG